MNHIFIELLNNALITSALIVAVILVRLCIKKRPDGLAARFGDWSQ